MSGSYLKLRLSRMDVEIARYLRSDGLGWSAIAHMLATCHGRREAYPAIAVARVCQVHRRAK